MKHYQITKQFSDENGTHSPGDKPLSLSVDRASKLKKRGYIGSAIEEPKTHVVKIEVDSEEIQTALKEATESLTSKNEEIEDLKTSHSEELERVNSSFAGFVSSVKTAKDLPAVKSLVDALDQIEAS